MVPQDLQLAVHHQLAQNQQSTFVVTRKRMVHMLPLITEVHPIILRQTIGPPKEM